jgi:hypothetical protein
MNPTEDDLQSSSASTVADVTSTTKWETVADLAAAFPDVNALSEHCTTDS